MLQRLGIGTSYAAEWGSAAGRFGVIAATTAAAALFLRDTSAFGIVLGLLAFGSVYSLVLLLLLARGRLMMVFGFGLLLDNASLLIGWWVVTRALAGSVLTNDLWLVLIPLIILGVVRLGWVVGSVYTALWIAWMAGLQTYYYPADSYDLEQLPVRVLFILVIAGLVMRLVSLLNRQSEHELERLREIEQLEAMKSTLLRTVAHKVKSPMTAVRAAADLLADDSLAFQREQRQRIVATLHGGVRRLEHIIRESLAYAELKGAGIDLLREEIDMRAAVFDAVRVVEPAAHAKGQKIELDAPKLPALVDADPGRIEQVLINLLTNAIKFTPPGGRISVSVHHHHGTVVTEVSNPGPRIPSEEQELIFEEYYQGMEPDRMDHASVGLGLTVARRLAEAHGGAIGVRSDRETPTTFTLVLPSVARTEEG